MYINSEHYHTQVHLIGNVAIWYAGTASLVAYGFLLMVYLLRRRRQCYDIPDGKIFGAGAKETWDG